MKTKLYLNDSSDDEDIEYNKENIVKKINNLQNNDTVNFISSYLLFEISESIIKSSEVNQLYNKKKDQILDINCKFKDFLLQNKKVNEKGLFGIYLILQNNLLTCDTILKNFYDLNTNEINNFSVFFI